jgi:hypothetical protein
MMTIKSFKGPAPGANVIKYSGKLLQYLKPYHFRVKILPCITAI